MKKAKEQSQSGNKLALMALSLAGGVAMGWISALATKHLMNRFTTLPKYKDYFIDGEYYLTKVADGNADETNLVATFFGDQLKSAGNTALDQVIAKITPNDDLKMPERKWLGPIRSALMAGDYLTFEQKVEFGFDTEVVNFRTKLNVLFGDTNVNQRFGRDAIAAVRSLERNRRFASMEELSARCIHHVDNLADNYRKQYAKEIFYFGNDPERVGFTMHETIEKQLWAMWLLEQDYTTISMGPVHRFLKGKDGIPLNFPILDRLVWGLHVANHDLMKLRDGLQPIDSPGGIVEKLANRAIRLESELKLILDWAKTNPGKHGKLGFKPRTLGTIREAKTLFK